MGVLTRKRATAADAAVRSGASSVACKTGASAHVPHVALVLVLRPTCCVPED